jgi:hypothetical protein
MEGVARNSLSPQHTSHIIWMDHHQSTIDYCSTRRKKLILGYDANTHHIIWGAQASIQEEKA